MRAYRKTSDLVALGFESVAGTHLPSAVFHRIARQTLDFNPRHSLTGELICRDGRFQQALEGPSDVVLALAARIFGDPRHRAIRIDHFREISHRRHDCWRVVVGDIEERAGIVDVAGRRLLAADDFVVQAIRAADMRQGGLRCL